MYVDKPLRDTLFAIAWLVILVAALGFVFAAYLVGAA